MMPNWVKVDEHLLECIQKSNTLNIEQYTALLSHVINVSVGDSSKGDPSPLELVELLQMKSHHVGILVKILSDFYKSLTTVVIKPTDLQTWLRSELKLSLSHADLFVKLWSEETTKEFGNFETQNHLENINWQVNIETVSSNNSAKITPYATVEFVLSELNKTSHNATENVMEISEDELKNLYFATEEIQQKLDYAVKML